MYLYHDLCIIKKSYHNYEQIFACFKAEYFFNFFYYGCLVRLTAHGNMSVSFQRVGPLTYITGMFLKRFKQTTI